MHTAPVLEVTSQSSQCGTNCGDEFTSTPTDYVLAAAFSDLANPTRAPGAVMLLKAHPSGQDDIVSWRVRTAPQYYSVMPPRGVGDEVTEARECLSSIWFSTCTWVSRQYTRSMQIVALSPTRLVATFVDGDQRWGTAVVVAVVHHLLDRWSFKTGLKTVFNAAATSNSDVAALSASAAVVAFVDDGSGVLRACVLEINGNGTDNVTVGPSLLLGVIRPSASREANASIAAGHRLSVRGWSVDRALVAYAPAGTLGEVLLLAINRSTVQMVVKTSFGSQDMDNMLVVSLAEKVLLAFRDLQDGNIAKLQELDIYEGNNRSAYALVLGSLVTITSFEVASMSAIRINATAGLLAFRTVDASREGIASLVTVASSHQ